MATSSSVQEAGRWSLAGATALVTGGSKGIGRAIVEELASFGATVHTCARNEATLNSCMEEWNAKKLSVTASVCDADREALAGRVAAMFDGKLDILVNNVGFFFLKPAVNVTPEELSRVMAGNLESCFHLSQLMHPLLKASGKGNIVNISGISTVTGFPSLPICAFSAAKVKFGKPQDHHRPRKQKKSEPIRGSIGWEIALASESTSASKSTSADGGRQSPIP